LNRYSMSRKMIKWYLLAAVLVLSVTGLVVGRQFLVFPWKFDDLPKMENPKLLITKGERKLEIFDGEALIKTYKIGLGSNPEGDKEIQGDGKTPEGEFYIFVKNPKSKFFLSLGLSYPSSDDAERGLKDKLISKKEHDAIIKAIGEKKMPLQNTRLGGEIYIHGHGSLADWTLGCIALANSDMKELFDALQVKTPVKVLP
jgi:murein L,D-transpeptidase YafK